MTKQKIEPYAVEGKPGYHHLNPVVEYLLKKGNESSNNFIWGSNRTGYFCHLKGKIDFAQLLETFDFPESIKLSEDNQSIDCFNTYSIIKGDMG